MPQNIEIKVRTNSLARVRERAIAMADQGPFELSQIDYFFPVPNGRLKLRVENSTQPGRSSKSELIAYQRPDEATARYSDYLLYATSEPNLLRESLGRALDVGPVVHKTRELFLVGRTRIHLDTVEQLGTFVEIEVVMQDGEAEVDGQQELNRLMNELGIESAEVMELAYADML